MKLIGNSKKEEFNCIAKIIIISISLLGIFGCQSIISKTDLLQIFDPTHKHSNERIDVESIINQDKFDIFCKNFVRDKRSILEVYGEILGERFISDSPNTISSLLSIQIENKIKELFIPKRKEIVFAYLHYPFLPDSIENMIQNVFFKSIIENNQGDILDRNSYKRLYNFLDEQYAKVSKFLTTNGVSAHRLNNIKLYIYDDGTKSINAYAIPGNIILISKELVQSALIENDKTKSQPTRKSKSKDRERQKSNTQQQPQENYRLMLLEFTIVHELTHLLKRHDLLKLQGFLIRPLINENYKIFEKFRKLHGSDQPNFDTLSENIKLTNESNLENMRRLMRIFEKEADACAIKFLLNIYRKEKVSEFINNEFKNTILHEIELSRNDDKSPRIKIVDFLEGSIMFIKNFLRTETEEHLESDLRIQHMKLIIEHHK